MAPNKKDHLRYRYGMCLNEACSKCKSKEVQQIPARKDFVCGECQKELRECRPPKSFMDKNGKILIGGGIALVALIAIWIIFLNRPDSEETPANPEPTAQTDSAMGTGTDSAATDTVAIVAPVSDAAASDPSQSTEPENVAVKTTTKDKEIQTAKTTGSESSSKSGIKVPFGTYSGPASGLDGEIHVTRHYTLDLRNAAHESIELQPGDVITRTKFKNGELVGGYWKRGSQGRSFHR